MNTKIQEQIIFQDHNLVAVNKPPGLLTIQDREGHPALRNHLQHVFGEIYTVHRLDRDTSGVVVFARTAEVHKQLSQLFEGRAVTKFYQGLVHGRPAIKSGNIEAAIMEHPVAKGTMVINKKGKQSLTTYNVFESFATFSWVQFQIHTGRTHQIRVHMKHIGHPIVCDAVYGDGKPVFISSIKRDYHLSKKDEEERPILARLALHSSKLEFVVNGKEYKFEAPLPKDLRALLQQLKKHSA
ncbi:MAG TPA: RluA family pseudouridine synthase [Chitinophagaceae bacterium]|jgi:23S rRNA pseudouridine955/2504/2580 synthase/23S rRNA pseudouridine1911/1915/1917 synthase|nr:RluA family pseudouridine synthase [Chitinophagaceae bacterium]